MKTNSDVADELYRTLQLTDNALQDPDIAHLVVNHNNVVGSHLIPGLEVEVDELDNGIQMLFRIKEGVQVKKPIHLCFGMIPENGLQQINLTVDIQSGARAAVLAHCTFPNAVDVIHTMDADITIAGARSTPTLNGMCTAAREGYRFCPNPGSVLERERGSKLISNS